MNGTLMIANGVVKAMTTLGLGTVMKGITTTFTPAAAPTFVKVCADVASVGAAGAIATFGTDKYWDKLATELDVIGKEIKKVHEDVKAQKARKKELEKEKEEVEVIEIVEDEE